MGQWKVLGVPARQAGGLQCVQQLALAQCGVKLPLRAGRGVQRRGAAGVGAQAFQAVFKSLGGSGTVRKLAGADAGHPLGHGIGCTFGQVHHALGDAEPGQAAAVARALVHRHQYRFRLLAQQLGIHQRARGDHPYHLALHRPFASDLAHLFANGDRFAMADQFGQIAFHSVKGHPSHHHRFTRRLAPLGQRDVQQPGGLLSIGVKHLIEVTHAVKEQGVGVGSLESKVLLHHGGVLLIGVAHRGESINFVWGYHCVFPRKTVLRLYIA